MERSDGILRMLKINYASSQDTVNGFTWEPVTRIFAGLDDHEMPDLTNSREVLGYMLFSKNNTNSIINIITWSRENARSVQEHITKDLWQCLNGYYHTIKDPGLNFLLYKDDPVSVLDTLIRQGMLYYGTTEITMERGEGRSFMNIGKYLERAIQSVDILDTKFSSANENPDLLTDTTYWKHLLQSLGGYELYLKTYRTGFEAENVLELVVLNIDFPRSVIYSVNNIQRYFDRLKNDSNIADFRDLTFLIGKLHSNIKYSSVKTIQDEGLHRYLYNIRNDLYEIGNCLNEHYFAYS